LRAHSSHYLIAYRLDFEGKSLQTAHWNELISSEMPWRVGEGETGVSAALPALGLEVPILS